MFPYQCKEVYGSWHQFNAWIKICKLSECIIFLQKPFCHLGVCIACVSTSQRCGVVRWGQHHYSCRLWSVLGHRGALNRARSSSAPSWQAYYISHTWTLMKMAIALTKMPPIKQGEISEHSDWSPFAAYYSGAFVATALTVTDGFQHCHLISVTPTV